MTYQYSTKPEGVTYVCEATANIDGMKVRIVKEIAAASMAKAAAEFEEHLDGGIDEERGFGHHNFTIEIREKGAEKQSIRYSA
jgi:hypothetical protein